MELVNESFTSSYGCRQTVHSLQSCINSTLAQFLGVRGKPIAKHISQLAKHRAFSTLGVDRARSAPPARRVQGPRRPGVS